ncbi:MAG: hypothetical protein OHK0053_30810 [Microscillaceae bacterium]
MLEIRDIHKSFRAQAILEGLHFSLSKKETISILGESGSGKTTLLKIIAGLEKPDRGEIWLEGQDITALPPHRRKIVYLYQESLLFPHLNARENLAFGLRLQRADKVRIRQKTEAMLEQLGLSAQAHQYPHQLSGGQKQRVAFGRAMLISPTLLLLDEPFSSLDPSTRSQMQELLRQMMRQYEISGIFVTHDLKEALLLGDRLALMKAGQLGMYDSKSAFIADESTGAQKEIEFWQKFIPQENNL